MSLTWFLCGQYCESGEAGCCCCTHTPGIFVLPLVSDASVCCGTCQSSKARDQGFLTKFRAQTGSLLLKNSFPWLLEVCVFRQDQSLQAFDSRRKDTNPLRAWVREHPIDWQPAKPLCIIINKKISLNSAGRLAESEMKTVERLMSVQSLKAIVLKLRSLRWKLFS